MIPSVRTSDPGPEAGKLLQTITLPPPYLTLEVLEVTEMFLTLRRKSGKEKLNFKSNHCSKLYPFMENGSLCGLLESQRHRDGFARLSRLIDVSDFVSQLFLSFFNLWYVVLFFEIF